MFNTLTELRAWVELVNEGVLPNELYFTGTTFGGDKSAEPVRFGTIVNDGVSTFVKVYFPKLERWGEVLHYELNQFPYQSPFSIRGYYKHPEDYKKSKYVVLGTALTEELAQVMASTFDKMSERKKGIPGVGEISYMMVVDQNGKTVY